MHFYFGSLEMKKALIGKNPRKPQSFKHISNMRLSEDDIEKNKFAMSDSEIMVQSQAEYIDNLQQQIFVLENEVSYLRSYMQESNKQHPSMIAEGERMVKKLAEAHNEIKGLKIETKRKQTMVDLLCSEKDRIQRSIEDLEEKFRSEKCKILEELITLQKERDVLHELSTKAEASLVEQRETFRTLQEEFDSITVRNQQHERESQQDREIIQNLMENKEKLHKDWYEAKMIIQAKSSMNNDEAMKELKGIIEKLHEEIETLKRTNEHEHMLRERLSQDNLELIRRHSELEAELSEVKAQLREEQSRLSSLEQVHLDTILEASEAKSKDALLKEEIERLNTLMKEEREHMLRLERQLVDEKRFKSREEDKLNHLQRRHAQQEENIKLLKAENIAFSRDNSYLKDQNLNLKQQLHTKDQEILSLKHKVREMKVSVEEFEQTSQASARLTGERWKQLGQLAQSIQNLTCMEEQNF